MRSRAGDIAAEAAERLGERALDHVDAARGAVALADAAAARAIHADGVDLVDISHGAVALGEIADAIDRRDIAVHRIEALEHDQLRPVRIGGRQKLLRDAPDRCGGRCVFSQCAWRTPSIIELWFERIRQDEAVRHQLGERGNSGLVGDVAGGENQRRFLAVQIGELALKLDQRVIVAGDVAGAAGAGAHPRRGLDHGADHLRMLAHAEIVVRAPDHDILRPLRRMPDRMRKTAGDPLEIGKHPVAPLVMQPGERVGKIGTVIHKFPAFRDGRARPRALFRVVPA